MEYDEKAIGKYLKNRMSLLVGNLGKLDSSSSSPEIDQEARGKYKARINEVSEIIRHYNLAKYVY